MANGWRRRPGRPAGERGLGCSLGCLLWLMLLVLSLVVLSVLFGGFRLGTRAAGPAAPRAAEISVAAPARLLAEPGHRRS